LSTQETLAQAYLNFTSAEQETATQHRLRRIKPLPIAIPGHPFRPSSAML